jgi:hypothetical protein
MEIIKTYSLYFNTRQATTGTPNNCTFLFTTPLTLTNNENRFVISTPMIELPYSFSQVNSTNNVLPYTYSDNTGGGHSYSSSITIPVGNYSITALQSQFVLSLLTDIYIKIPTSTLSNTNFIVTYSQQTGLTLFYITGLAYTVTIVLQFSQSYVLGIMFGFPPVNQTFGTAVQLTSPNKVQVNPITSVYLRSETLRFECNYEALVTSYTNADIIAKIPVTTLPNSIIYYRNDQKYVISNRVLAEMNLYLSDNLSDLYFLDMSGVNYGINILIEEVVIKPNNSYKDRLPTGIVKIPKDIQDQRDQLLNDLLSEKERIEKELSDLKENVKKEK